MMNAVKNSDREMMTEFGGAFWRPMAVLSRERTITIRTKDVVIISIEGARERTVMAATSCTIPPVMPWPVPRSIDTV
jgi:hypothetical protein